jgi:hypothetical protein
MQQCQDILTLINAADVEVVPWNESTVSLEGILSTKEWMQMHGVKF